MATITGSFAKNNANLSIYIDYSYSQSIANNTTTITASLKIKKLTSYATTRGTIPYSLTINGTSIKSGSISFNAANMSVGAVSTICSGSITISHNSDGTKSTKFSAVFDTTNYNPGKGTVDKTVTLPTIPRKTTVSLSGGANFGSTLTINHAGASSSFTHNIKYAIGSTSGTIATGKSGTSTTWTIPLSLQSQIPNSKTGTLKILLETVSGGKVIGSSEASKTVTIASSCVPSVTSATFSDGVTKPSTVTGYYQNFSKLKAVIVGAGIYGSTISKYGFQIGNTTYKYESISNTIISDVIVGATTWDVTVWVIDSRGVKTTKVYTSALTAKAYSPPVITNFTYKRTALEDGIEVPSNMGTIGYFSADGTFNAASTSQSRVFKYRTKSGTTWTTVSISNQNYTNYKFATNLSAADAYILRFEMADMLQTVYKEIEMANIFPLITMNANGDGIAFGKDASSTSKLFECDLNSQFNKEVLIKGKGGKGLTLFEDAYIKLTSLESQPRIGYEQSTQDVYISNQAGNWLRLKPDKTMTYGGLQIYNSSNWAQSKAANGYCVLPNGVIMQWGGITITPTAANTATQATITFPKVFPNACASTVVSARTGVPNKVDCSTANASKTSFVITLVRTDTTATGINWVAFGY